MHRPAPPPVWSTALALVAIVGALVAMLLVPWWQVPACGPRVRESIARDVEPARDEISQLHSNSRAGRGRYRADALDDGDAANLTPAYASQRGPRPRRCDPPHAASRSRRGTRNVAAWADKRAAARRPAGSARGRRCCPARGPAVARTRSSELADGVHAALYRRGRARRRGGRRGARAPRRDGTHRGAARRWTAALGALAFVGALAALWLGVAAHRAARVRRDRGEALERPAETRARFTRGLSHDLKNPLGAIDGYADLIATDVYGPTTVAQRRALDRIRAAVRALLALVDDLLALGPRRVGRAAHRRQPDRRRRARARPRRRAPRRRDGPRG
jgi:hypothetical protein